MLFLRALILALVLQHGGANSLLRAMRKLSQEFFLSYEPVTTVTDHAAIDLDQQALEAQLALGTDEGRQAALKLYTEGAFSKSYAEITLSSGLPVDVGKDVTVVAKTPDGKEVRGKTMVATKTGDTILEIQYHASPVQSSWTNCHVGGNPEPNTEGCFAASGNIEIGELGEFPYTYNVLQNNYNARTLQGFSIQAKEKMYDCPNCPYPTFQKFHDYYGQFDYANKWVLAAFNKGSTNFNKGNAQFSNYGTEGTTEAIKKGTAYMNTWMYVNREMEDAVDDCEADCATDECNDDQVHAWDEAVAFYTGSVPKNSGDGGYLLYTLAQKRCENFGTCLTTGNEVGMAQANSEIFLNFRQGKQNLLMGNCDGAKDNVNRITQLMAIPLIQGTLRYAYVMDKQNDKREKAEAEGATFAAAVLPLLHACNADDAAVVYDNMKVGNGGSAKFDDVKQAFERNYACLGVTCQAIGGLVDVVSDGYLEGAEPCGSTSSSGTTSSSSGSSITSSSSNTSSGSSTSTTTASSTATSSTSSEKTSSSGGGGANVGLAVGLTIGIVALLGIIALLISRKSNEKEFDGAIDTEAVA